MAKHFPVTWGRFKKGETNLILQQIDRAHCDYRFPERVVHDQRSRLALRNFQRKSGAHAGFAHIDAGSSEHILASNKVNVKIRMDTRRSIFQASHHHGGNLFNFGSWIVCAAAYPPSAVAKHCSSRVSRSMSEKDASFLVFNGLPPLPYLKYVKSGQIRG